LVPDAPLNLRDNLLVTSARKIGLLWQDGVSNGGKLVIDYVVSSDQSIGEWIDMVYGVETQSYTTTFPVLAGATYLFKVRSRNSVGLSDYSNIVSILVAQAANPPDAPTLYRAYD